MSDGNEVTFEKETFSTITDNFTNKSETLEDSKQEINNFPDSDITFENSIKNKTKNSTLENVNTGLSVSQFMEKDYFKNDSIRGYSIFETDAENKENVFAS